MHISYIFSVTLITLASAAVIPDAGLDRRQDNAAISYKGCDRERSLLEADFEEMQVLARKAAEHVDSNSGIFIGFFGREPSKTNVNDARIKKRYTAMSNFKSKPIKDIIINCNTNIPACKPANHIVAADKGGPNIYICNSYWYTRQQGAILRKLSPPKNSHGSRPLDEFISVGAQLLHELTHAWFVTEDKNIANPAKGGLIEKAYSHRNALLLAQASPQSARENADNYKLFAIASYFDRSHWSVDPDKLSTDQEL